MKKSSKKPSPKKPAKKSPTKSAKKASLPKTGEKAKSAKKKAPSKTAVAKKAAGPQTIDAYLDRLNDRRQREALEHVRKVIKNAAPEAEECISYQIPSFRLQGMLVGFGASSGHCSFFPMSGHTVAQFATELTGFETSKGTIRFTPEHPLPDALIEKIVKSRVAENLQKASGTKSKSTK